MLPGSNVAKTFTSVVKSRRVGSGNRRTVSQRVRKTAGVAVLTEQRIVEFTSSTPCVFE